MEVARHCTCSRQHSGLIRCVCSQSSTTRASSSPSIPPATSDDTRSGLSYSFPKLFLGLLCAALTCLFALAGALAGAVAGAFAGRASDSGVLRGAGLGALAGAVLSVEILQASRIYWCAGGSDSQSSPSMDGSPSWNLFLRRGLLGREIEEALEFIQDSESWRMLDEEDSWMWCGTNSGLFLVGSMYSRLREREGRRGFDGTFPVKLVWRSDIPPKICFFLWATVWNRLATLQHLGRRGLSVNQTCILCGGWVESRDHLLIGCSFSWEVWSPVIGASGMEWAIPGSATDMLQAWDSEAVERSTRARLVWRIILPAAWWAIWKERNSRIFRGQAHPSREVFINALAYAWNWARCSPVMKVAFIEELFYGRLIRDHLIPTAFTDNHWQASISNVSYDEMYGVYQEVASRGLPIQSLRKLPSTVITNQNKSGFDVGTCCTICLQDIEVGETVRQLLRCHHLFHLTCVDKWLVRHGSCPVCRQRVLML